MSFSDCQKVFGQAISVLSLLGLGLCSSHKLKSLPLILRMRGVITCGVLRKDKAEADPTAIFEKESQIKVVGFA